jgi:glucose/arabinose dehydrogenase
MAMAEIARTARRGGARVVAGLVALALSATAQAAAGALPLESIKLPAGFSIALYTGDVPGARSLAQGPPGILFVGTREQGKVYGVIDADRNGTADRVVTLLSGLDMPNGVAFRDGSLYVAEVSRILRYDRVLEALRPSGARPLEAVVVRGDLPRDRAHGWKFIRFGPDGRLYVPIGAPCNVCSSSDPRFASITRMKADGSGFEVFAKGVRNSVGFDWDPVTKDLWFTDNGRDMMGDDRPPDELNRAPTAGLDFGFPACHGGDIPDPRFAGNRSCASFTPPAMKLGPHVASLGMRFYTGRMFPSSYRRAVFIAEHGSWNRSHKIGYRVSLVRVEGPKAVSYETFASGWLQGETAWGRPVDVEVLPDGSLLVSDDRAGAIYRIRYAAPR